MTGLTLYPSLKDRSVFITGGASGIGAAFVEAYLQQGMTVGFVDYDEEAGHALCEQMKASGLSMPWFRKLDVTDVPALKLAVNDFAKTAGRLDVLVSNVANDTRQAALDVTEEEWRGCIAVNLDAAFFAVQAAVPELKKAGGGSVIIMSSITPLLGLPNMSGYATAKSALLGMTKSLANEFGPDNIRVNAILPGWVITERQKRLWYTDEEARNWQNTVPLKKTILAPDVAKLGLFLAADDSEMITSQHFIIDTGRV
ncbi:SDR family NAD(P)-dependent oxidoreductase [Parvularcula marina]|uniref:SDR family NAD(P)-dependent oxidoreductase n=1 Tax=Parvularcula marina TaxID=2292771 RepID=UPI003515601A